MLGLGFCLVVVGCFLCLVVVGCFVCFCLFFVCLVFFICFTCKQFTHYSSMKMELLLNQKLPEIIVTIIICTPSDLRF